MANKSHFDRIIVVNGPEDGTEFPIVRSPFTAGSDMSCAVHLSLDAKIMGQHAEFSVAPNCYSVRTLNVGSPAYINDKSAGAIRVRTAKDGDIIRMGNTLFRLDCVPEGLAARSEGVAIPTGTRVLLKLVFAKFPGLAKGFLRRILSTLWRRKFLTLIVGFVLAMILFPVVRHAVAWQFRVMLYNIIKAVGL